MGDRSFLGRVPGLQPLRVLSQAGKLLLILSWLWFTRSLFNPAWSINLALFLLFALVLAIALPLLVPSAMGHPLRVFPEMYPLPNIGATLLWTVIWVIVVLSRPAEVRGSIIAVPAAFALLLLAYGWWMTRSEERVNFTSTPWKHRAHMRSGRRSPCSRSGLLRPDAAVTFGTSAEAIWRLLQGIPGWRTINVDETHADTLGKTWESEMGRLVQYHRSVYHVLTGPPRRYTHPLVRRLTIEDIGLIEEAPSFLQQGRLFGGPMGLLREGIIAGAIDAGRLVAIAHTSTISERYTDIGVATLQGYRRQGIAQAAASLVCDEAQMSGRTPIWDCSEDNVASRYLAQKLGFTSIGHRVELLPLAG